MISPKNDHEGRHQTSCPVLLVQPGRCWYMPPTTSTTARPSDIGVAILGTCPDTSSVAPGSST
jgi:hypothetical protein